MKSLALTKYDEDILLSGKWLTANHINAAQRLLRKRYPQQAGLQDTHYLYQNLQWASTPNNFVQVIFVDNCHWACLSNKFCGKNVVQLYDSMHTTTPTADGTIVKQVCAILSTSAPKISLDVVNVQCQGDLSSCGLYALACAFDLCKGVDPFAKKYVGAKMRHHLHVCFENEKIVSFPSSERTMSMSKRLISSVEFELHCVCRQPEYNPMAACDSCGNWFHKDCQKIPAVVFKNKSAMWRCDGCV